ncbi:ImmA/IrrE family metallo-endopeptidase [Shewanella sp. C32]|uniref:ImmA/IrrE family metallo-endopeptidase n=1 Tax=Shewanella electrica TaxID=515560 RepID=A0ABT2FJC5_9GAMM|nr:ImmA/IrrE family metallo-endopeptidase [Shewanella electrica]MCH1924531.1 ImmA/IrrE family metallo-endopeptidase [Shewanella electrica]MCS4556432.1 ImmA/IrrE family metallo-endopeptidase [Shewanella electrica]
MSNINMSKEHIENARMLIRQFHNILPVKVGSIASKLGVKVKISTLPTGISGEIKKEDNTYIIKVNRHDVKERQRFTIAHEIGHFILHKEMIGDGIVDDALYRSKLSDRLEAEANKFAAEILMPWDLIKSKIEEFRDLKNEELYEALSKEFEVSTTAIKIRLGKL